MVTYYRGESEVKGLAAQAGKAQAERAQAQQQLEMNFRKEQAMMDYQFRLEAERRARAWDLEKMEIASRLDFEQSERQRVKQRDLFTSGLEQIQKREAEGVYPQDVLERAKLELAQKFADVVPEAAPYLGIQPGLTPYQQAQINIQKAKIDPLNQVIADALAGKQTEIPKTMEQSQAPSVPQAISQNQPRVSTTPVPLKDVAPKDVPQENGRFIVISPSGAKQTIRPDEFAWAIEQGYTTQPIVSGDLWNAFFGSVPAPNIQNIPIGPIPGVGFGGAGYNPTPKKEGKPNPLLQLLPWSK